MTTDTRTVWKYPLPLLLVYGPGTIGVVELPVKARFLRFAMQNGTPTLWCEVMPLAPMITREFCVVGTGQTIPVGAEWVGTCLDGAYVWHLYVLPIE